MKRLSIIIGAFLLGVAVMLGILQPWKRGTRSAAPAPTAVNPDPHEEALRLARLADEDIQSHDFATAQRRLAEAASMDSDLFEVALYQGQLDMLLGNCSAARRSYSEALKRRPGDAKALAGRAAARFELGEHAGAIEDATAAAATEPDALFTRAAAHGALGRWEEALRDWTAYLARRPRDAHAWTNRGNAHDRMGNKAAAVTDWAEAVRLEPSLGEQLNPLIKKAEQ